MYQHLPIAQAATPPAPDWVREQLVPALFGLMVILIIFIVTLLLARFSKVLTLRLAKRGRISFNLAALLGNLATVGVLTIGIVVILSRLGVEWSGVLTVLGALGIAVSLALQDVLRNFVSGVYLLIERPFGIGDIIEVRDTQGLVRGSVQGIELRTTLLRTEDGTQVIVPNATLFTQVVINRDAYNLERQTLELSATSLPLEQMAAKVNKVLAEFPEVVALPSPETSLISIAEGKMRLRVVYWTKPGSNITSQVAVALRVAQPTAEISLP